MGTPITAFPIATTPVSGLNAFSGAPAAGDYFPAVRLADTGQAPTGSLARVTWAQMMTSPAMTGQPSIAAGTATTAVSPFTLTQTWNNAGVIFPGVEFDVTDTASDPASRLWNFQVNGSTKALLLKDGSLTTAGNITATGTGGFTGTLTGTTIVATSLLNAATTGVRGGLAVQDATTSAATSYAPKGLGIKAYIGADKAGVNVTGSADGDAFVMSTAGSVLLSSGGANIGIKLDTSNEVTFPVGGLAFSTLGKGLTFKSGSNAVVGTGTFAAGVAGISNSIITSNTDVYLTATTSSAQGFWRVTSTSSGVINLVSTNGSDASAFKYVLIQKN